MMAEQFFPNGPQPGPPLDARQFVPNPLEVPVTDREFFWNQLVDTVDDYFSIATERRAEIAAGLPTEGLIETHYQTGATCLEPWLWDSASEFERTLATLQSIRRRARLQIIPTATGYGVNVEVFKELEDVARPAQAMPGSSTPRHDGSLVRQREDRRSERRGAVQSLGWIPIGRDAALEQEILRELYGRLFEAGSFQPGRPF
jgi:hypothetical protein